MTKKTTLSTFLTIYLSIFSILISTMPHPLWAQSIEMSKIETSPVVDHFVDNLKHFNASIYHSNNKNQPALLEQIQKQFQKMDIDDEAEITFDDFDYQIILNKFQYFQQKALSILTTQELSDQEISTIIFSTFAYLDLALVDMLSIWKSNDHLAQRYSLQKKYQTYFPINYLSDEIRNTAKLFHFTIVEADDLFSLQLSPFEKLKREMQISVQIPSVHNYLKGVRLMALQMMMQQQSLYQSFLGTSNQVTIPRSCQDLAFTRLPSNYKFQLPSRKERDHFIQNMLAANGLNANSEAYQDYYLYLSNPSLASGSVTKLLPFQQYSLALKGLQDPRKISIDDNSFFRQIINLKQNKIIKIIKHQRHLNKRRACGGRRCMHKISLKTIEEMESFLEQTLNFSTLEWVTQHNGSSVTIDTAGLNQYLLTQLKKRNIFTWEDLLPAKIIKQWKQTKIKIDYPREGMPIEWTIWSLKKLNHVLKSPSSQVKIIIAKSCRLAHTSLCIKKSYRRLDLNKTIFRLKQILQQFDTDSSYIPTTIKSRETINKNYKLFVLLWNQFTRAKLLNNTVQEFQLLQNQMNSENHWATLFISFTHFFNTHKLTHQELRVMQKIAHTLGIHNNFSINIADKQLSIDEKKSLWQAVLDTAHQQNSYLFNQKTVLRKNNISYYDLLNEIANKNLFTPEQINKTINSLDRQANIVPMYSAIKSIQSSPDFEIIHYLQELYNNIGNAEKEEQIVEILLDLQNSSATEEDDWNGFYSFEPNDIKKLYLEMDNKIKTPIYTYIVQDAASLKLRDIKEQIQRLCQLDEENIDDLKDIYYATSKAQMKINQQFGIEANAKVHEFLNKYNDYDKKSLWFGLGSAALFIGSTILGAGCTLISGGLCMPLTAAVLASMATGTQLYVAKEEFEHSIAANERAAQLAHFNALGLTSINNVEQVKRSYAWGFLEVAFTIPMIGQLSRGIEVGGKIIKAQLKGSLKNLSKTERQLFYKEAFEQTNAKYAQHILGLRTMKSDLHALYSSFIRNKHELKTLSQEIKHLSIRDIDESFADSLMTFFANKPRKFNHFLSSFSDHEIQLAKKQLQQLDKYNHPEQLSFLKRLWGKGLPRIKIKHLQKFLQQEKSLQNLVQQLNAIEQTPEAYRIFITKHADSISTVITSLPFQKKELGHMLFALGGPTIRTRIPLYSKLTEVTITKRIVSARQLLNHQLYRELAAQELGLSSKQHLHQGFTIYQAFAHSIRQLTLSSKEKKSLLKLEYQLTQNIMQSLQSKGITLETQQAHRLLFTPSTVQEVEKAKLLWNNVPTDKLFTISHEDQFFKSLKYKLQTQTKTLNGFQDYVHLLKFMAVSKTPELANII